MTEPDPEEAARLAEIAEQHARTARLEAEHGKPEPVSAADALVRATAAGIAYDQTATADDLHACIYRSWHDADAWLESNWVHHGHPVFARVPHPDGRVIGIIDLRPALARSAAGKDSGE